MKTVSLFEDIKDISINVFLVFTILGFIVVRLLHAQNEPIFPGNNSSYDNSGKLLYSLNNASATFKDVFVIGTNDGQSQVNTKPELVAKATPAISKANQSGKLAESLNKKISDTPSLAIKPADVAATDIVQADSVNSLTTIDSNNLLNIRSDVLRPDLKL
ncbi:hypothetical protein H6800_00100 [Candidatus Nomurabacteria bacterium]|nr:hypothetical protein [Candidatus Nomurabacteria bacterium]